ncbi:hypothetical protein [Sphingomonas sp. RB1R13]|uniref:hypothetical protein n=1 Tax=Sphingomonas sp. RB1R13 TaxID=3096159 RepID=UPI002FCBEEE1
MSNYPAKMAVVVPGFVIVDGDQQKANPTKLVYLNGFAILKVERRGRGFKFEEFRQLDETGTQSARLLKDLAFHLDPDTTLAGHRLDLMVDALIRVPCGDQNEAGCKPALLRLQAALTNEVQDAYWWDRDRHRSLEVLASEYALPAEWHRPNRQCNPNKLGQELSAKAQSIWLIIAHEWLTKTELCRATADYDQWRTAHSIA